MMTYNIKTYKDGQIGAELTEQGNLHVKIRGNSYEDLFAIASIKEAWDYQNKSNPHAVSKLSIMCLIGQRSDRRFEENQSFDLKVIANFINSLQFHSVEILHPHSAVSLALIHNSVAIDHFEYVKKAYLSIGNPILISPDAGAYKTTHYIAQQLQADLVPSNKVRVDGKPQISIQGDVKGKVCLIVDDMADGGRTFSLLAKGLKEQGAQQVFLYVTHGMFNYGFDELDELIDHIYCTNSYKDINNSLVTQFKVI
jgi:ribose-phosphate pyrophosphokinase